VDKKKRNEYLEVISLYLISSHPEEPASPPPQRI
jgi:hypothetical protein